MTGEGLRLLDDLDELPPAPSTQRVKLAVPYDLTFEKTFEVPDQEGYWNDCCFGGDVIVDQILPSLKDRYSDLWSNQEDWGWFIWFREGGVKFAIEVFCQDRERGEFRVHLSSSKRKWLVWEYAVDTPELERLRDLVHKVLSGWLGNPPRSKRVD